MTTGRDDTAKRAPVLVIEDDAPTMRLMLWALGEEGIAATATDDPARAPDAVRERQPRVVVLNTGAPSDKKRVLIEAMRQVAPVRVIDLAPAGARKNHDSGADAYLNQPYAIADLVELIVRLDNHNPPS